MKRFMQLSLCAMALAALAGCFETKETITLNPDGSGKMEFSNLIEIGTGQMAPPPNVKPDPQGMAKFIVTGMVKKSQGIDAWSDLSYKAEDNDHVSVKGVAYFPDVSKVSIGGGRTNIRWTVTGQTGTLELVKPSPASAPAPKEMTDKELADAIADAKTQYQKMRPKVAETFEKMKLDITYALPGKLGEVEGFNRTGDSAVQLVVEGAKLLAMTDKLYADDAKLAAIIKSGRNPIQNGPGDDADMMEALFGKGVKNLKASASDLKQQFDYKAEMEKAKAGQDEMLKKAGIDLTAQPMMQGRMQPAPADKGAWGE